MKADPKPRKNGGCAQCGKPRIPKKGISGQTGTYAKVFALAVERDPFCSADCCRAYHGTPAPEPMVRVERTFQPVTCGTWRSYEAGCRCDLCREKTVSKWQRAKARQAEAAAA